jgi:hypothetical protein
MLNENKTPEIEIQQKPRIEVVRLRDKVLYVSIEGRYFQLKNVELSEVEDALYHFINRYDSEIRYRPLKYELMSEGKIVIENDRIEIYNIAPYEIIAVDFALYLVARIKEDDEGARVLVSMLGNEEKSFIMYLIKTLVSMIPEEQLKRIHRVMETVVRIIEPKFVKPRQRKEDYQDFY